MFAPPSAAAALLAAALCQAAAAPPPDGPPVPADAARTPDAAAAADDRGTIALPPTGGERRTADRADVAEAERLVTDLTNAFREENGLPPVTRDETLAAAAAKFGRFLADRGVLGHQAGGTTPADRVEAAGYAFCSVRENLAYQFDPFGFDARTLAETTVTGWKESPGHRANLLADDVTETGVGVVYDAESGRYFAVQLFALPEAASVTFEVENRTRQARTYRLAGRAFELPPRSVRSHVRCSPGPVTVRLGPAPPPANAATADTGREGGEAETDADAAEPGEPVTVRGGQVLILRPDGAGGVRPEVWSPPAGTPPAANPSATPATPPATTPPPAADRDRPDDGPAPGGVE